jgi:hypothetical protein
MLIIKIKVFMKFFKTGEQEHSLTLTLFPQSFLLVYLKLQVLVYAFVE